MKNFFGTSEKGDKDVDNDNKTKTVDNKKLHLRKEELDINKNRVSVGEVEISKEIIEEQKAVDVPLTHEEVVIKRRALDNERSDTPIGEEETIHIPVSEERVDVDKHTIVTGEVEVDKREVQDTRKVRETLKKEEARVHTDGNPKVINDNSDTRH